MRNHTADRTAPATRRNARADARLGHQDRPAAGYGPVFVDPTARRTRRAMLAAIATIILCLLYVAVVAATMLAPVEPDTWSVRPDMTALPTTPPVQVDAGRAEP